MYAADVIVPFRRNPIKLNLIYVACCFHCRKQVILVPFPMKHTGPAARTAMISLVNW